MNYKFRWSFYLVGVVIFSYGIAFTVKFQHLGVHPWDVLNVAFSDQVGLTVGSWNIIISGILIIISLILDHRYVKAGTFVNAIAIGLFVDFYLWIDFYPAVTGGWLDVFFIMLGITIMGFGGGMYNAAGVGSGPRDGFMLSISDKTGASVGKVRIITESLVLIIGLLIGGPVFVFTFLFTFIQSPIFQWTYNKLGTFVIKFDYTKSDRVAARQ